jgi:hypothetical protein
MQEKKAELDFIVVGVQKAGTTSLFEYLRQHPEISLPAGKEVPYFSHDALYALGWATYMRKLAIADPTHKWGTVTPHYLVGGVYQSTKKAELANSYDERTVPRRIRDQLPNVRLIAILRDPVERARSHHRMMAMEHLDSRSFDDAVDELLRPEALEHSRRHPRERTGYVAWGEYGRTLGGYFDVFAREQILVVFADELEQAPAELLRRIHAFIGVKSDFEPENLGVRYRVGASERRFDWLGPYAPLSPHGLKRALTGNSTARSIWHLIPESAKRRVRHPYERFALRFALWNRRPEEQGKTAQAAAVSATTLARLREHYAEDTERLAVLLGRSPTWATSAGPRGADAENQLGGRAGPGMVSSADLSSSTDW